MNPKRTAGKKKTVRPRRCDVYCTAVVRAWYRRVLFRIAVRFVSSRFVSSRNSRTRVRLSCRTFRNASRAVTNKFAVPETAVAVGTLARTPYPLPDGEKIRFKKRKCDPFHPRVENRARSPPIRYSTAVLTLQHLRICELICNDPVGEKEPNWETVSVRQKITTIIGKTGRASAAKESG